MEFGIFAQLFVPKFERAANPRAEHDRIMRNVDVAVAADQNNFKYVWAPEHHFLDEYSHMPGPEVYGSFVAAKTERIHIGSAIFNITAKVNHPARIAEKVALMDHLFGGRYEFGTGRGSSTTEVFGFDIPDLEITKAMWEESIREIPKMWKPGTYSYEGEFFRLPEREVFPKPNGWGHPAMWVAAGSPPTFAKAAEKGLGTFCFTTGSPTRLAPLVENYKNEIGHATPVGDYVNDNIMGVTNMVCMEDRNKAFEVAAGMQMNYYSSLAFHWLDNIPKPKGLPEWPERLPEPTPEMVEQMADDGLAIVGDPDDCARGVQAWADCGFDQLTFSPTTNTLDTDSVIASMELFGTEVIPRFDKEPEHSTTRYRREAATKAGATYEP